MPRSNKVEEMLWKIVEMIDDVLKRGAKKSNGVNFGTQ